MTAFQVGFPYPTSGCKPCRDRNPDPLIEKANGNDILKIIPGMLENPNATMPYLLLINIRAIAEI